MSRLETQQPAETTDNRTERQSEIARDVQQKLDNLRLELEHESNEQKRQQILAEIARLTAEQQKSSSPETTSTSTEQSLMQSLEKMFSPEGHTEQWALGAGTILASFQYFLQKIADGLNSFKDYFANIFNNWTSSVDSAGHTVVREFSSDSSNETSDNENKEMPQIKVSAAWERLWNEPNFQKRVLQICSRLHINPEHLKLVMNKESGINHKAYNKGSGASWLIQFMPETAKELWTTTDALRKMSPVQQLDYVERFFAKYPAGTLNTPGKLYTATFYPYALKKHKNFIIGSEVSMGRARKIAAANPGIAKFSNRKDGLITNEAFERYVYA